MNKLHRRDVIRIGLMAGGTALLPGVVTRAFAAGAPEFLTINGGGQGGAWYLGAAAIGELCKKDVWPGVSTTVQAGGGKINARQLHQKKIDFGFMFALDATHAYKGKLDYKDNPMTNLRAVMSTNIAYVETVVKPGIKSYAELSGKAVDPGRAGMTGLVTFKYIIDALGLKVKLVNSGYPEMASLFKDGVVQGVSVIGSNPHTSVSEIMSTSKGALLPVDDKLAKIMVDKYDYELVTIPANTYPGQTKDVPSIGSVTQFVTHAEVPEEWVYKVTKVTWEHRQRLVQAHKAYKELDKKMVLRGVRIPLHPGAARYWKEVGIQS
jgi:TRAP transporter TAXI family solute receptor